jgi:hypothetical protein
MGGRAQCRCEREVRELEKRDKTFPGSRACYIARQVRDVVVIRNARVEPFVAVRHLHWWPSPYHLNLLRSRNDIARTPAFIRRYPAAGAFWMWTVRLRHF